MHSTTFGLVCYFLVLSSLCSTSVTPKERRGRRPSYPQQLMKYKLSARMISIYQIDYLSNLAPTSSPPKKLLHFLLPLIIIYTEIIIIITLEVGVWRGSIRTIIMKQLNSLLSSSSTLSTLTLIPMYHIELWLNHYINYLFMHLSLAAINNSQSLAKHTHTVCCGPVLDTKGVFA